MSTAVKILGSLGLALTIAPALLYLGRAINEPTMKLAMLCGTVLWFATAPWFLKGGGN